MDSMNRIAQYEKIAVQKEVMPAASAQNVGKVYQYVGETTGSLTKGMFYEVVSNGGTYSYQVINIWLPPLPELEVWDEHTYILQAEHTWGVWNISWVQSN